MQTLVIGLLLFFAAHSVAIVAPGWREAMMRRLGAWGWKLIPALVSLLGFVLIVRGYATARAEAAVLYVPPVSMRHVAALLMLPVFPLLVATYLRGHIAAALKHPMLVAVKTWAVAHLLVNGSVADLLLFGSFLAWAVVDRIAQRSRAPVERAPPARPLLNDAIAVLAGLALYAVFVMHLHQRWFGVSPMPVGG